MLIVDESAKADMSDSDSQADNADGANRGRADTCFSGKQGKLSQKDVTRLFVVG